MLILEKSMSKEGEPS